MKTIPFTKPNIEIITTALSGNQPVILPTDTIYGIHLPYQAKNLDLINKIKKRPLKQPCNVIYSHVSQITNLANESEIQKLYKLKNVPEITVIVTDPDNTVGQAIRLIRFDSHPILYELLSKSGPLYSSSANVSGETYNPTPEVIIEKFKDKIAIFATKETVLSNIEPSTIIDIRGSGYQIIRPGIVSRETIDRFITDNVS